MAAITETSVGRSNIRLTSTEFPDLSVEGGRGQARDLRKKLNNMMREKRRKSGGTLGKSPRFNKLSADPKKAVEQSKEITYNAQMLKNPEENTQKEEVEIDEARQLKDPKKEVMVVKGNKVIVID